MKKCVLILGLSLFSLANVKAQMQIDNSDFEQWKSVSGGFEPVNWNSFLTASGGLTWAADNQLEESSDVRPGSTGTKSARIWSRSAFGVIANGNLTLGKINMGSLTPTGSSNYNWTDTGSPDFHQVMTDKPDSLVFWVKFIPNGHNGNARVKATIHDNYDYRDPEDANAMAHVVGIAELNFPSTNNEWVRKSIPFDYSGPATDAQFILLTFTTSETAGGGKGGDEVFIDDVELIYNSSEPGVCQVPTDLAVSNTTGTDADVSWTAGGDETEWKVVYGPEGFNVNDYASNADVVEETVNIPTITLTNLDDEITYDVYVIAVCDTDSESDPAGPVKILDAVSSIGIETLTEISIYPNPVQATLTIDNVQKETEYAIHSVLGGVIKTGKLSQVTNEIETSTIQKGVYILRLTEGVNTRTLRFIKN